MSTNAYDKHSLLLNMHTNNQTMLLCSSRREQTYSLTPHSTITDLNPFKYNLFLFYTQTFTHKIHLSHLSSRYPVAVLDTVDP